MKAALLDTDILSLFLKGVGPVVERVAAYLQTYDTLSMSIITYYEIVSGLKYRDAHKQLGVFLEFAEQNTWLPLTRQLADVAAELYADLRQRGQPLDDIDLLIASTALANGMVMVTHNRKHFERIVGLEVADWTEEV